MNQMQQLPVHLTFRIIVKLKVVQSKAKQAFYLPKEITPMFLIQEFEPLKDFNYHCIFVISTLFLNFILC